jgi:hypothetical protein
VSRAADLSEKEVQLLRSSLSTPLIRHLAQPKLGALADSLAS